MAKVIRWGILGAGNIARQFADGFSTVEQGVISAIGSRRLDTARAFAELRKIPQAFGSYDAVIASSNVDAVYIALPNTLHRRWAIQALEAGKHVLCEKPIAASAAEAEEMFDVARRQGRILMEAFMYRCHPLTHAVHEAVRAGKIGRVRLIRTSFCFRVWNTVGNIRFDASMAGGALMDIGCYCLNFSRFFAGAEPLEAKAFAQLHASGVDELAVGMLQFPGNISASFTCGMNAQADNTACICGDEGYIEIPVPWKPAATDATWTLAYSTPPKMDQATGIAGAAKPPQTFSVDAGKSLYALEADDFAASILSGRPPTITPEDTLGNMRLLDELRRQVGVARI